MEREEVIRELSNEIESMARMHIRHGLYHSEGLRQRTEHLRDMIREHKIDVRKELDPMVGLLYRRYYD